jgi:hypothetical protein
MKRLITIMVLLVLCISAFAQTLEENLFKAVREGNVIDAEIYLDMGADVNYREPENGDTVVMIAIRNCHYDVLQVLLREDIDLDIANKNGETAMNMVVSMRGLVENVVQGKEVAMEYYDFLSDPDQPWDASYDGAAWVQGSPMDYYTAPLTEADMLMYEYYGFLIDPELVQERWAFTYDAFSLLYTVYTGGVGKYVLEEAAETLLMDMLFGIAEEE